MIKVKFNIDFSKIRNILKDGRLTNRLNKEIAPKIAKESAKFIRQGKVIPELSDKNPRKIKNANAKPLFDTGKLAKSLKGNKEGISGVNYAKDHLKEKGYRFNNAFVPQRKFIVAKSDGEYLTSSKVSDKLLEKGCINSHPKLSANIGIKLFGIESYLE